MVSEDAHEEEPGSVVAEPTVTDRYASCIVKHPHLLRIRYKSVSYTHLTLPTILLV